MLYNLTETEDQSALTAIVKGEVKVATREHPNWTRLLDLVRNSGSEDELYALFDPESQINNFFKKVSERVSVANGVVYLDHEPVSGALADHIVRYTASPDHEAEPLIQFLEKISTNPNEHSREQLYAWLSKRDFTITADGDFLAYKGVRPRDDDTYPYESISRGKAIVDGQAYEGAIPNGIGAVVEMPRGDVAHDPDVACHTGLHAGNWRYASGFSQGAVLLVKINPRDVVSVPHDSNSEKIRCCRYTVVKVADGEINDSYYTLDEDESEWDDEYEEY